jgi:hypothetical protein
VLIGPLDPAQPFSFAQECEEKMSRADGGGGMGSQSPGSRIYALGVASRSVRDDTRGKAREQVCGVTLRVVLSWRCGLRRMGALEAGNYAERCKGLFAVH